MKASVRERLGLWLERFTFLDPVLLRYSHEYPEGTLHYVNRLSRTFAARRGH